MDTMNLNKDRAVFALEKVTLAKTFKKPEYYKNAIQSIIFMIRTNGLINALAFFKAKDKEKEKKRIYEDISEWLIKKGYLKNGDDGRTQDAIHYFVKQDSLDIMYACDETLALLNWLKRFSDSEL